MVQLAENLPEYSGQYALAQNRNPGFVVGGARSLPANPVQFGQS